MVAWLGTQQAQRVLIGLSALAGLLVLAPFLWAARDAASQAGRAAEEIMPPAESPIVNHQSQTDPSRAASATASFAWEFAGGVMLTVALGVASWLAWSVPQVPSGLIAYGRYLATRDSGSTILYMGEGMNASVAVSELDNGVRNFHVSGKVEASTEPQDMRLQRMLGHIPALLHRKPRSVLIVGCGAGVTAGSFVLHPDVERIVICEIEPLIPRVVALYFDSQNYSVLKDPRVRVVYDDARHYILRTDEKFDIITSDPIHPWVKGAATLYTKEYFDLCKRHLNPGGLVTQWVPLYESNLDVVKSEIATFFEVFPHGTIWGNDQGGEGYDTVLLGQAEPIQIHVDGLQRRLDRKDHAQVARSLEDVAFKSAVDLLSTYAGQGPDLVQWLKDAEINRDRNLRLQYLAGLGLNSDRSASIYDDMLAHRRFPEELFQASSVLKQVLRKAIEPTPTAK
ncbi:MAG: fused MFS/spermidine synthase [Verrucomicrobia bacterium]|nr:fused MFS/spermidine synthase [Verrucomicrobiota bacterium]